MDRVRGAPRWLCLKPCCAGYSRVLGVGHGYLRTNIKVNERAPVACRRRAPRPPHGGCPTPGSAHRPGRGAHGLMGRGRRTGRDAREARPPRPPAAGDGSLAREARRSTDHMRRRRRRRVRLEIMYHVRSFSFRDFGCVQCAFLSRAFTLFCVYTRGAGGTHVRSTLLILCRSMFCPEASGYHSRQGLHSAPKKTRATARGCR